MVLPGSAAFCFQALPVETLRDADIAVIRGLAYSSAITQGGAETPDFGNDGDGVHVISCRFRLFLGKESAIISVMGKSALKESNRHLRDTDKARRALVRNLASSTAIETGESITVLEARIMARQFRRNHAKPE